MAKRHFLFLQGMPSPFFSRIAWRLEALGCRATGINLCFADWLFWRGPRRVNYRGGLARWPGFIAAFFDREGVTDLVLLGEQRNYHQAAIAAAQARGIRVCVTDFGYLRPDWITLERDGMSGNSRFPRDPEQIRRLAAAAAAVDFSPRYADSALRMALGDLAGMFGNVFLGWLYPGYRRSDKRLHPFVYVPLTGRRLLRARMGKSRAARRVREIVEAPAPYFVFPLQLEHDFQIVAYSPFDSLDAAIRLVLRSFAARARPDTRLVVKVHPWEPGLKNWEKRLSRWAAEFGVAGRVDYLDGGDLDALIRGAKGMVTVNSTSGIRALQLGCPLKILGQAVYDVPGLVFGGELDDFWHAAAAPDPVLAEAFIRALAANIQIRGVFFSEPGLSAAVDAAVERLYAGSTLA